MASDTTSVTAGEIMDQSAVLLNDPAKTDYTYAVLEPFLRLAYDELVDAQMDSQNQPLNQLSAAIIVPIGANTLYPQHSLNIPKYPAELAEIQEISERLAGSDDPYIPMKRAEFPSPFPAQDRLSYWAWEMERIQFNPNGATTARELIIKYIRGLVGNFQTTPESIVGGTNSRAFLSYKTAALAAQFIGENPERAAILDGHAQRALERHESISNKGRQQIMTRHRPFRANWKARGGF